ncbi:MAG: hypothetical protein GQ570_15110 [Helicobacteraceae bacterium]|nr:hypothetical protein [Helicobacteraceae bacterium]
MLNNEERALIIYLESATFENNFTPLSYARIAEKLDDEEYTGSKSAIGRWAKKYEWEAKLHLKRQEAVIAIGGNDSIQAKALVALDKKSEVDVKRNSELIGDTYEVLEAFIERVKADIARGVFKRDDIKLAKDIAVLVTGREDKMLDRLAGAGADRISSEELKKEFDVIEVEFE